MRAIFSCALVGLAVSGCADLRKSSRINPQTVAIYPGGIDAGWAKKNGGAASTCPLAEPIGDSNVGAINLDCFQFPEDGADRRKVPAAATSRAGPNSEGAESHAPHRLFAYDRAAQIGDEGKLARNRLAAILLKHADDICTVEKGRLVRSETSANFLLSLLTTGLSAASTIVTGERTKTILSGLATASSGTQDNVNATFYKNQLVQAIGKVMDADRLKMLAAITGNLSQDPARYPVDEMIRQVNSYHQACSFEHGMQLLLDAAVDSKGADAALQGRANQASRVRLEARLNQLQEQRDKVNDEAIQKSLDAQIADVNGKLTALAIADSAARTARASASDAEALPASDAAGAP